MPLDVEMFTRDFKVPEDVVQRVTEVGFGKVAEALYRDQGFIVPEEGMTEKAAVQIIGERLFLRRAEHRTVRDGLRAIAALGEEG